MRYNYTIVYNSQTEDMYMYIICPVLHVCTGLVRRRLVKAFCLLSNHFGIKILNAKKAKRGKYLVNTGGELP